MFGSHLQYLGDLENVGGDRCETTPPLPSDSIKATHFSVCFKRFVHHSDEDPLRLRKRNVWRDVSDFHDGLICGTVCEERATINFCQKVSGYSLGILHLHILSLAADGALAIVLADAFPYITPYKDEYFKSSPRNTIEIDNGKLSILHGQDLESRPAFRDRLINEALPPLYSGIENTTELSKRLCLVCSVLKIVASEWAVVLHIEACSMVELEKVYLVKGASPGFRRRAGWVTAAAQTNVLNQIIRTASSVRENIDLLSRTLLDFQAKDFCGLGDCPGCIQRISVIKDFEYLLSRARSLQERNDEHLRISTSIISIDESQVANHANKSLR